MVARTSFTSSSTNKFLLATLVVAFIVLGFGLSNHSHSVAKTDVPKEAEKPVELNASNVEAWSTHILPDESELAWRQIPWLWTLQEGILKAAEERRPVLLWTMNGHPLGCT